MHRSVSDAKRIYFSCSSERSYALVREMAEVFFLMELPSNSNLNGSYTILSSIASAMDGSSILECQSLTGTCEQNSVEDLR